MDYSIRKPKFSVKAIRFNVSIPFNTEMHALSYSYFIQSGYNILCDPVKIQKKEGKEDGRGKERKGERREGSEGQGG